MIVVGVRKRCMEPHGFRTSAHCHRSARSYKKGEPVRLAELWLCRRLDSKARKISEQTSVKTSTALQARAHE
jgi:hypothetical protein